ncbi:hypothetical protein M8494_19855 [Serratia ureilytica]
MLRNAPDRQPQRAAGHLRRLQPGDRPETARGKLMWTASAKRRRTGQWRARRRRPASDRPALLDRSCADDIDAARRLPERSAQAAKRCGSRRQRIVAPGGAAASTVSRSSHPVALRAFIAVGGESQRRRQCAADPGGGKA